MITPVHCYQSHAKLCNGLVCNRLVNHGIVQREGSETGTRLDPAVQWAGRVCMGVESRLSGCAMGWQVMHWGEVQAVRLYNGLVDSGRLYIGPAVRLCNGAG